MKQAILWDLDGTLLYLSLIHSSGGVFARVESGMLILPTVGQCTGISRWTYAFSIDRTRYFLPGQLPQVPGFSLISHYRALGPKDVYKRQTCAPPAARK